jgi:GH24 family phage-related lysozyme (muramidase)
MTEAAFPADAAAAFEREKWEAERGFRERELALREREQQNKETELALTKEAHAPSRWRSPVIVAVLAAAAAAAGNAFVAYTNSVSETKLEAQKAEHARILAMVNSGNPDKVAENLRFLLQAGLLDDAKIRRSLDAFLDKRKPGTGPTATSNAATGRFVSQFEGRSLKPFKDQLLGAWVIGSGHILTRRELATGVVMIGGKPVAFQNGITVQQSDQLKEQDLAPIKKKIDKLVKVPLTKNQRIALASFVYNVGFAAMTESTLLPKLNAGDYDAVPREMLKWSRVGGRVMPGLLERRKREAALWKTP